MKLTSNQMLALAQKVLDQWKQNNLADFKVDEKIVLEKIQGVIRAEIQKEIELEKDVNAMLEQLERSHGGQFERHKMYPMLKNKMAKERKLIL